MHGQLVYHGNHCGPGNKGVRPAPVDALDATYMRHDVCVRDLQIPSCGCNARPAEETAAVAVDPSTPWKSAKPRTSLPAAPKTIPCQ